MLYIFLEGVCSSFILLIIMHFLRDELLSGAGIKPKIFIWLAVIYVLLSPSLLIDPTDNNIAKSFKVIYMLCPIIIACIDFGIRKLKSILYTFLVFWGVVHYISYLLGIILSFFYSDTAVLDIVDLSLYLITLILVMFIYKIRYKDNIEKLKQITLTPTRLKILVLFALWISSFFCEFVRRALNLIPVEHANIIIALFVFSMLAISLIGVFIPVAIVFDFLRKHYESLSKTYEEQARASVSRYELMQEANADLRKFRHDLGNLFIGLKGTLKGNDEALNLINSFEGKVEIGKRGLFSTNNYIIDALLQEKQNRAKKSNTTIEFKGLIPPDFIDLESICIMFGVPLDNAIEACEKLDKDTKKVITVISEPVNPCLFISIKNPVAHDINIDNNQIKTSKKDKTNHGIGLYSLNKALEKYNGNVKLSCKNNIFKTKLSLFYR